MHVYTEADQPLAHLPGIEHRTLAGGAAGLSHLSVWRQFIASGAATPAHRHDCEEVILVESGEGELVVDGARHAFGPRSTLVIPPNVDHQVVNTGAEALHTVAIFAMSPVRVSLTDGQPLALPWAS